MSELVSRIEPDRVLLERLRSESKKAMGFDFFDCRWDDARGALAIYQKNIRRRETVREYIVDDDGEPRQLSANDVEKALDSILTRREWAAGWYERYKAKEDQRKEAIEKGRRELAEDTAKELARYFKSGLRTYVFQGDTQVAVEEEKDGVKVTDRRRVV